jgi:hypothetical protein
MLSRGVTVGVGVGRRETAIGDGTTTFGVVEVVPVNSEAGVTTSRIRWSEFVLISFSRNMFSLPAGITKPLRENKLVTKKEVPVA